MDSSRVEAVGPDRAAAEWILRLGGSVKFQTFDHWNSDYNLLPSGSLHLQAINGTGLAITNNGLEHLGKTYPFFFPLENGTFSPRPYDFIGPLL